MKLLHSIITTCILLTAIPAVQAQKTMAVPLSWKKHTDSVYNFTLYYPPEWKLKLPGTTTRFFVTSQSENEKDQFNENLNCVARALQQQSFKVADAEAEIKKTLMDNLKDYHLIYSGYSTWNGVQTLTLEYSFTKEDDGKTYNLHMLQKIAVVNGILFTLTYSAEDKSYAKFANTINKIIGLMEIK
ncbi:MAG: PsbP-related protein [Bacteroidetes bacterium]|nr:PsbP-related protein [Bacteroidota bacterium]